MLQLPPQSLCLLNLKSTSALNSNHENVLCVGLHKLSLTHKFGYLIYVIYLWHLSRNKQRSARICETCVRRRNGWWKALLRLISWMTFPYSYPMCVCVRRMNVQKSVHYHRINFWHGMKNRWSDSHRAVKFNLWIMRLSLTRYHTQSIR